MKKIFFVHGFNTGPNSSWIPWMMGELKLKDIYASSLTMPNPANPNKAGWVSEIERQVLLSPEDEIYMVGHSLGSAAILNFLQTTNRIIAGVILVSGRCQKSDNPLTESFYESFDFKKIKEHAKYFVVIHGDTDDFVPVENAYTLAEKLGVQPLIIKDGKHLTGSQGWRQFPQCLEMLYEIMSI